ncbi:unnamed protein product, partial [Polarella glacialis]
SPPGVCCRRFFLLGVLLCSWTALQALQSAAWVTGQRPATRTTLRAGKYKQEDTFTWGDFNQWADGAMNQAKSVASGEKTECWRALTKIRVRTAPDIEAKQVSSKKMGPVFINAGAAFQVAEVCSDMKGSKRRFMRLAGSDYWVFDLGTSGSWLGKPVIEPDNKPPENPVDSLKKLMNPYGMKIVGSVDDML